MNRRRWFSRALLLTSLTSASCLDPAWANRARVQRAALESARPRELRATPETALAVADSSPSPSVRVLRMRAHATPRHAAEVGDWKRELGDRVEDANRVLGPTLGVRIDLVSAELWDPQRSEDELSALVEGLAIADSGADVDWILGLAGSVPRLELSFHQLGAAKMMSKHLVVRTMNDAREYDAFEAGLAEIDERERRSLYRARRRHKSTSVLLHELAHTLGVPHEQRAGTIMQPRYHPKVDRFSVAAVELMRISAARPIDFVARKDRALPQALLGHVQRTSSIWVPDERDDLARRLDAMIKAGEAAERRAADQEPAKDEPGGADALRAEDRTAFAAAVRAQRSGDVEEAWQAAEPLFDAYPEIYAVQDLRCQLAMQRGLPMKWVEQQCDRLMRSTPGFKDAWVPKCRGSQRCAAPGRDAGATKRR
jgi:hypothetical protein